MRCLLVYHRALGDIVGSLAAAKHLTSQGHDVWFETMPAYADIFHCVDYCRWKDPAVAAGEFDLVIPMQISTPSLPYDERYHRFRAEGRHWFEFAYEHPAIAAARWQRPVFTRTDWFSPEAYGMPADRNYVLVCAAGISQQQVYPAEKIIGLAKNLFPGLPLIQLAAVPTEEKGFVHVRRLRDFPGLIAHPKHFLTINSGPAWIAAGARQSYHHISQFGWAAQDNSFFPGVSIEALPFWWKARMRFRRERRRFRYYITHPSEWFPSSREP